jgi:hypothetical protein
MSEMYDIYHGQVQKASTARECAVCNGTADPITSVFLPTAEVTICRQCANDIVQRLGPKPQTIPISSPKPARKALGGSGVPFDVKRMAHNIKMDVLTSLLAMSLSK